MDVSTIEFTFNNEKPCTLSLALNIETTKLSKLRTVLITQFAPGADPGHGAWRFIVNDEEIGFMDAANRTGHQNMRVALISKKVKQKQIEKRTRDTGGYNLINHLRQIMAQNDLVYVNERESNGIIIEWIFNMFGRIKAASLTDVSLAIQTEYAQGRDFDFIRANYRANAITICPFLTPGHIALLCCYNQNRLIHFDSSSSFHSQNASIFQNKRNFASVSYTYVNYQLFDETDVVRGMAGGNCGMFTGINAIQAIRDYGPGSVSFMQFWNRLLLVLESTPDNVKRMILHQTMRNIWYAASGNETTQLCKDLSVAPVFPINVWEKFPDVLKIEHPDWIRTCDFVADYQMLNYFIESKLGFDQVARLGNAARVILKDIIERGFFTHIGSRLLQLVNSKCANCDSYAAHIGCDSCKFLYCGESCRTKK